MAKEKTRSGEYSIRCMEFGDVDCNWEAYGKDEDEAMREAERHGRDQHGWTSFNDEMKDKVRGLIRRKAA